MIAGTSDMLVPQEERTGPAQMAMLTQLSPALRRHQFIRDKDIEALDGKESSGSGVIIGRTRANLVGNKTGTGQQTVTTLDGDVLVEGYDSTVRMNIPNEAYIVYIVDDEGTLWGFSSPVDGYHHS